jgi:RNA polymerase subunit RPABC4/transcription elongation factor Spt4
MPTFKHPCPHCGKYIARDVAACPFCARPDPFAPARCPNCRTIIEDRSWTACPKCGQTLVVAQPATGAAPSAASAAPAAPAATQPHGRKCTGCGAPLTEGARFCTVCGTLAA